MNPVRAGLASVSIAAVTAAAAMLDAGPAQAVCSVFDRYPCHPTFCGVFHRGPCVPEIEYPIGQDLRLTIESAPEGDTPKRGDGGSAPPATAASGEGGLPGVTTEHKLNTILEMYAALRACWVPPPADGARPGMQMSVRLSFKRSGEIIGSPRVTYTTPGAPPAARDTYHEAITEALTRCTPMPFTAGLGGAVAGRPINIRYVDNRKLQ